MKAVVQQDHIGHLIVVELQVGFLYHEEESIDINIVNIIYSATQSCDKSKAATNNFSHVLNALRQ